MRRFVVLTVVLALALVLPTTALAKSTHYAGTVTPSGTVAFKLNKFVLKKGKKRKKVKTISAFSFDGIPVSCADGAHVTHGKVTFAVKFKGSFTFNAESSATGAKLHITGNLAAGTLQVSGNVPIDAANNLGSNCDSGLLNWTAARG